MQRFTAIVDDNWSPLIKVKCPSCSASPGFYTKLAHNCCKHCSQEMPFPTEMAKNIVKRVEYHVPNDGD